MKFCPYKKVIAMLKGVHKTFWGSFYVVAVLAILKMGTKCFHLLKGEGGAKHFTLS